MTKVSALILNSSEDHMITFRLLLFDTSKQVFSIAIEIGVLGMKVMVVVMAAVPEAVIVDLLHFLRSFVRICQLNLQYATIPDNLIGLCTLYILLTPPAPVPSANMEMMSVDE